MKEILREFFSSSSNIAIFISAVSVFIAAVSTVVSIIANRRSQKHYKESTKPQLSMKLVDFEGSLYLQVKNTGKTAARKINIVPIEIKNNGDNDSTPNTDGLFSMQFELYPEETVQSEVGYCFQTISTSAFPQLSLSVEYFIDGVKKQVKYNRTVTFAPAYDTKIIADVNIDNSNIEQSLKSISRASVRTANYLDGCQVAEFDQLDIIAGQTLCNDLKNALGKEEEQVLTRTETLDQQLSKGANKNG